MNPKDLSIKDYTYDLPAERIAKYPMEERDASQLLIYQNGQIAEDTYQQLAEHIPANSFLIFNNTKVVAARLLFQKDNGSIIEIFCLEPDEKYPDITTAMLQKKKVLWKCLVGGAKKWKEGSLTATYQKNDSTIIVTAYKHDRIGDSYIVELSWNVADMSFSEVLHVAGLVPLPPYLERLPEENDKERYQTIYAKHDGSVAAPTAGLHFTDALFDKLSAKSIHHSFVSLHVGAGTFKPVKTERMEDHEMHAEFIDVEKRLIERLRVELTGNIIPVGTTSLRTIESLYWMGVKTIQDPLLDPSNLFLSQWEPYELDSLQISAGDALAGLLTWMNYFQLSRLLTKTQIIIAPGYQFRIIKALVTNFHQPQSTLLLLVAALIGDDWKKVYAYALQHKFRFLSYGDGSLLWKK